MLDVLTPPRAIFDATNKFRYQLWREFGDVENRLMICMLNPSVADSERLDATIRRCLRFAQRLGFGALDVGNLFAYRSTDPRVLSGIGESAVGPENDGHLRLMAARARKVIVAWGNNAERIMPGRAEHVLALLRDASGGEAFCFNGLTKANAPPHPLYLRDDAPLVSLASLETL